MKLFKYYNINWEEGGKYVIRKTSKYGNYDLQIVRLQRKFGRTLEFSNPEITFLLLKSDFEFWGSWEMIEQIKS